MTSAREPVAPAYHMGVPNRFRFLTRNRFQLAGAFLWAVLVPALLRSNFAFLSGENPQTTAIGSAIAVVLGAYFLRRMTIYPGVNRMLYVIPAFSAAFTMVIIAFFFFRIDYARLQFIMSFAFAIIWFVIVSRVEARLYRPRYWLVPFGNAGRLVDWPNAEWVVAATPDPFPAGISGVVADLRAETMPAEWEKALALASLRGIPVYHCKQLAESMSGRVEIEHLSENNLGSLVPSFVYLRFKRLADIAFSLVVLPFAAIIATGAAIAIKRDDGGPILFRQERMGFRGKPFTVLKFRTMTQDASRGAKFTSEDDPRITRAGRFLRRYRIDELPQIVNILRGEMSWIGPRPEAVALSEWYESKIPFYSYRHIVRPGITGWAAVNQGNVAQLEAATGKLHYDFYYIKYFSPWLDLLIVGKTIRTVLTGFGSR